MTMPNETEIWVALETATDVGSVAVWLDSAVVEVTLGIRAKHSERLLPALDFALRTASVSPEEVSSFVVGAGPGSFTGVRVGAALAKGWVVDRETELYAYPSLMAVAAGSPGPVCAMFDARRGEVYAACYEAAGGTIWERLAPGAWRVDALLEELRARELRPTFAGQGAAVYAAAIARAFPDARVLPSNLGLPRASNLLWLRSIAPSLGRVERPDSWEPLYVRDWTLKRGGSS